MKLETYAKIGILSGMVLASLVAVGFTLMILHHEFDIRFDRTNYLFSEEDQQKVLNSFYNLPEYKKFKELYPDSLDKIKLDNYRIMLTVMQYEPTTENALLLEIRQDNNDGSPNLQAHCDAIKRKAGERMNAEEVMIIEFIKSTECLSPAE
ncbi:MAG: hypothetical protein ACW9W3_01850 [Candidatus Nitrosopumilus sp. bin_68KS]